MLRLHVIDRQRPVNAILPYPYYISLRRNYDFTVYIVIRYWLFIYYSS